MKRVLSIILLIAVFMPMFATVFSVSAQENETQEEILEYCSVIDNFFGRAFSNEKKEIQEHKDLFSKHSKYFFC